MYNKTSEILKREKFMKNFFMGGFIVVLSLKELPRNTQPCSGCEPQKLNCNKLEV